MFDRLEVVVEPRRYVAWPNGGGFQPVTLRVNGTDLIDIIRRIELPHAEAEFDRRNLTKEGSVRTTTTGRGDLAGSYMHLPQSLAFLPSRNLLGEPYQHGFACEATKSLLLQCTCGITECWFLLAQITVDADRVTWSDFEQFHRSWTYDLELVFDRAQYEAQLVTP